MRKCAIRTKRSHGPSVLDVNFWSKILYNSTFGNASDYLCHTKTLRARMLCSGGFLDLKSIAGLVACQLIHLNKIPGVKSIDVYEVLQRIFSKGILTVLESDILNVTG